MNKSPKVKNSKKTLVVSIIIAAVFVFLFAGGFFSKLSAQQPENYGEILGWAWSENIGWIAFNCESDGSDGYGVDSCTDGGDYGVSVIMDPEDNNFGYVSGYAWSSNLGWMSFNPGDIAECEQGAQTIVNNLEYAIEGLPAEMTMTGWGRFLNGTDEIDNDFWNGCVSFGTDGNEGNQNDGGLGGFDDGVFGTTVDSITGAFDGWAWGDKVVGWITLDQLVLVIDEIVIGCTDSQSSNYNPDANVDDGSCEYPVQVILDANPNVVTTQTDWTNIELVPFLNTNQDSATATGCSIIHTEDSPATITGNGVSNNNFSLPLENNQSFSSDLSGVTPEQYPIITYQLSCDEGLQDGEIVSFLQGCTDPAYEEGNYNPLAVIDNGSCVVNIPGESGAPIYTEI
jgi:hypothetical protein